MGSPAPIPDLVCADARVRVDLATLRQALVFAFASSGSSDVFDDAMAKASLPASSWDRTAFARDLYLDEVVESCLGVHIGGTRYRACARYLARVLGRASDGRSGLRGPAIGARGTSCLTVDAQ